jgi:hypothetical protein
VTRRYGVWAGCPEGVPEDPTLCVVEVWDAHRARQCGRKRGHGPEGKHCKQHDPAAIQARIEKQLARAKAKTDAYERSWEILRLRRQISDLACAAFRKEIPWDALDAKAGELNELLKG